MVRSDILQMQKRGSISNQSIPTLRMREEMSTLDYVLMVSVRLARVEDSILYGPSFLHHTTYPQTCACDESFCFYRFSFPDQSILRDHLMCFFSH